jgi:hypothetical protein
MNINKCICTGRRTKDPELCSLTAPRQAEEPAKPATKPARSESEPAAA